MQKETKVMTVGEIRANAKGNWIEVARIDGVDATVHVWVDEAIYQVATVSPADIDSHMTDVVSFDAIGEWDKDGWVAAFREALHYATESIIAQTKLALG